MLSTVCLSRYAMKLKSKSNLPSVRPSLPYPSGIRLPYWHPSAIPQWQILLIVSALRMLPMRWTLPQTRSLVGISSRLAFQCSIRQSASPSSRRIAQSKLLATVTGSFRTASPIEQVVTCRPAVDTPCSRVLSGWLACRDDSHTHTHMLLYDSRWLTCVLGGDESGVDQTAL